VSLTLLPADWRRWLLQRVEHGEKPADLLRHLSAQGHLTAHAALLAVNEALAKTAANRHHDATAGGLRPRLNTDRRLLNVQGRSVLVRATLDCSGLAVLDDLLDGYECAELCVAAEREAVDSVAGASVRAGLGSIHACVLPPVHRAACGAPEWAGGLATGPVSAAADPAPAVRRSLPPPQ